jgi:hypothetical protein
MACQGQSATLLDIQFNSNPAVMVGDKFQQLYNAANVKILSSIGGAMNWPGVITPSALSANTNNYAPTGFSSALVIVQDITTAINLTGLAGGTDGRVIVLRNERVLPASDAITLVHESGSSTAANRFFLPAGANVAIPPQASVILRYHTNRWYLVARGF